MADGTPIAIEPKGIVRNQTKLGSQDGTMHDLINLRFKDGSWRTSGNGKRVTSFIECASGIEYQQLYVHTNNKYKHLLGVSEGKLYWFANIDNNGQDFYPINPKPLTTVTGDMHVNQTGHLITIIDGEDNFEYFVFKIDDKDGGYYKQVKVDENGSPSSREIYPFGRAHFNLWSPMNQEHTFASDRDNEGNQLPNYKEFWQGNVASLDMDYAGLNEAGIGDKCPDTYQNLMVSTWAKATKANQFTNPFLACVAVELYDGSWVYASNPVLLFPHDSLARQHVCWTMRGECEVEKRRSKQPVRSSGDQWPVYNGDQYKDDKIKNKQYDFIEGNSGGFVRHGMIYAIQIGAIKYPDGSVPSQTDGYLAERYVFKNAPVWIQRGKDGVVQALNPDGVTYHPQDIRIPKLAKWADFPVMCCGGSSWNTGTTLLPSIGTPPECYVFGSDLTLSLTNTGFLEEYSDVFKSIGIFITNPSNIFNMEAGNKEGVVKFALDCDLPADIHSAIVNVAYIPKRRTNEEIIYDLMHSPFYLLRKYTKESIRELESDPRVKLTSVKYKEVLKNITQQQTLDLESSSRTTYLPQVAYSYNNRLHIANYKSVQFHGYPLDCFQLHNNLVYYRQGQYFEHTLKNLWEDTDQHRQYSKTNQGFFSTSGHEGEFVNKLIEKNKAYAFVSVKLETDDGEQVVTRYIEPYLASRMVDGDNPNFIQSLNPLLTFPDSRAKEMRIMILGVYQDEVSWYSRTFKLEASSMMNIAYFFNPDMKPIDITDSQYCHNMERHGSSVGGDVLAYIEGRNDNDLPDTPSEQNATEYYPNGIKVSKADNPFFFPYESTYRIGHSSILAIMSNTIAVGTGQTGEAPLYVFCQDGVYALFVDSSGEMVYSNSRILTRDVLSVPRSVTPIDNGVVFITERGLMCISGNEVIELGQPVEGDVEKITQPTTGEWNRTNKFIFNRATLKKLGNLPQEIFDGVDFLTYLNDKKNGKETLINYNHNERELIVSNSNYPYSYVLDSAQNWSRRTYTADQFVNNFPTSYRVKDGEFYKMDDEGDLRTEHVDIVHVNKSEADNNFFALSNPLKLESIGFKQGHRLVVRGHLHTDKAVSHTEDPSIDNNYQLFGGEVTREITLPATVDGEVWNEYNVQLIEPIPFTVPEYSSIFGIFHYTHYELDGQITITLADTNCKFSRKMRPLTPNAEVRFVIIDTTTEREVFSIPYENAMTLSDDGQTITINLASSGIPQIALKAGNSEARLEMSKILLRQYFNKDEEEKTTFIEGEIPAVDFGETEMVIHDGVAETDYHIIDGDEIGITLFRRGFRYTNVDNVKGKISGKLQFVPAINGNISQSISFKTPQEPTITFRLVLKKAVLPSLSETTVFDVDVPVVIDTLTSNKLVVDFDDFIDFSVGNDTISTVLNSLLRQVEWSTRELYLFELILEDSDIYVQVSDYPNPRLGSTVSIKADTSDAGIEIHGTKKYTPNYQFVVNAGDFSVENFKVVKNTQEHDVFMDTFLGCYIMGSYDGRKWAILGGNEKSGDFTDIGSLIERSDMKFFRICMAGQLKGESRIDHFEISSKPSKLLNTKIR